MSARHLGKPPAVTQEWCERCGGEGKLYTSRYGGNDPDVWPIGECPVCEGTGYALIETEEEEAAAMDEEMMKALEADGEMLKQLTGEDHGPYFVADSAPLKRCAVLSFEGGLIEVNLEGYGERDGAGRVSFKEDDLDYGHGEDRGWRYMRLPKSELEEIRDFLIQHLGTPKP